jgi:hypothetical protein
MFKGNFKFKNSTGFPITYTKNDVVVYHGKVYQSKKTTQNCPQDNSSWEYLSITEPYYGSQPPVNPKVNQFWVSNFGIMYVYTYDGSSYQWIET